MCKKLVIAAVAVLIGTLAVRHSSLVKVWYQDAKQAITRSVPLETQIRQLNEEIGEIDKDIKKNLGKIAAQEAEVDKIGNKVTALKDAQANLQAEMTSMIQALDNKVETVSINGHNYRGTTLAAKLERNTAEFNARKNELNSLEQLLGLKKQGLDSAMARIRAMGDQKAKLTAMHGALENRLQSLKLAEVRDSVNLDLDESQVNACNRRASEIDDQITVAEKTARLQQQFGYTEAPAKPEATKPTADVLKAAKKALANDQAEERVADNKE